MLFNRCGWAEWVTVDNWRLMSLMQIKREKTFIDIRDNLVDASLIEFKRGMKGKPSKYKLISFERKNTFKIEVDTEVDSEVNSEVNTEVNTEAIYKQNKTKQNKKSSSSNILATVDKLPNQKSEEEEIFDLKLIEILEIDCKMYGTNSSLSSTPNSRHNKTKDKDKDKNIGSIDSMNEDTPKVVPSHVNCSLKNSFKNYT